MRQAVKQLFVAGAMLALSFGNAFAEDDLNPFVLAYTTSGDVQAAADEVKGKLKAAGFEVVGSYSPYEGAVVIGFTSDGLKKTAASSDMGGYEAGQHAAVTKVGDEIQVSYTNPVYYANAYRNEDMSGAQAALEKLKTALGAKQAFGAGDKELDAKDLRKYHYMFGMEYFDDPSDLGEFDDQKDAVAAVEKGLSEGRGGVKKVYRIDIPGKDETVFGVALTDSGCSGDEYIMSRIDKGDLRSTAHLPYEILVSDGKVYALFARFRIAISFPSLPMMQSETGATFFNIMCAPNAIEESLMKVTGG